MENNINMSKRKYRYTFQGMDAERNIIIPAVYCKIDKRPSPFNHAISNDDEVITDSSGNSQFSFFDINTKFTQNFMSVKYGTLTLLDGVGSKLEEWSLSEIKIININKYPSDSPLAEVDEIDCEINLTYEKSNWFNHATLPQDNPVGFVYKSLVEQANKVHKNTMQMEHYIPLNNNTEIGKQLIKMSEIEKIDKDNVLPLDKNKATIILGSIVFSHTTLKKYTSDINVQSEKCQEIYQTIKELYPDIASMYEKDFETKEI